MPKSPSRAGTSRFNRYRLLIPVRAIGFRIFLILELITAQNEPTSQGAVDLLR